MATVEEPKDDTNHQEPSLIGEADSLEMESSQGDDEGLYIPAYLEEALPDNPTLQVKIAHAMQAQEKETRYCYKCNKPGHLLKDHDKFEEKMGRGPPAEGASPKQVNSRGVKAKALSARLSHVAGKLSK